jgi:hypothetical protein
MTISTSNLQDLPDVPALKRLLQSIAMLDAILQPEWQYRYYSFNARWSESETMGSMRDGEGDEFFVLFNAEGAFIKGFVHEAAIAGQNVPVERFYRGLPPAFEECARQPAFSPEELTFCLWRVNSQRSWSHSDIPLPDADADGSASLLTMLDGSPETYRAWAMEYYERDISLEPVAAVYRHEPLTEALIQALNPEQRLAFLRADIEEIAYPAVL